MPEMMFAYGLMGVVNFVLVVISLAASEKLMVSQVLSGYGSTVIIMVVAGYFTPCSNSCTPAWRQH